MSTEDTSVHPLLTGKGGQVVRHKKTLRLGMTTEERRKNTPRIAVIWQGKPYAVLEQLTDIEPVLIDVYPIGY